MKHDLCKENSLGDVCKFEFTKNYDSIKEMFGISRPFIIKKVTHDWPAKALWNLDYLNQKVGHRSIRYGRLNNSNVVSYDAIESQTLGDFINYLKKYLSKNYISKKYEKLYLITSRLMSHDKARSVQLPELLRDINIPPFIPFNKLWEINMWMGCGGNRSNLHFDPEENLLIPLFGSKKIILFPPNQSKFLYQNNSKKTKTLESCVDVFDIDRKKFPLIDKAMYWQTEISEGEGLYIPAGWWHAIESSDYLNIAVNIWWLVKSRFLLKKNNPAVKRLWQKDRKWLSIFLSDII